MPRNYEARDRKLKKRRSADMVVSNRSIFVMEQANAKRGARIVAKAEARARKEKYRED